MPRFIPKEKLSKKARKALDGQQRATWLYSPRHKKDQEQKALQPQEEIPCPF